MEDLDLSVLDHKFLSNGLEMLSWNIDFLIRNADFTMYTPELFACLSRIKTAIMQARSQYVNELRFTDKFLNCK